MHDVIYGNFCLFNPLMNRHIFLDMNDIGYMNEYVITLPQVDTFDILNCLCGWMVSKSEIN
jgi:hypothetical protein